MFLGAFTIFRRSRFTSTVVGLVGSVSQMIAVHSCGMFGRPYLWFLNLLFRRLLNIHQQKPNSPGNVANNSMEYILMPMNSVENYSLFLFFPEPLQWKLATNMYYWICVNSAAISGWKQKNIWHKNLVQNWLGFECRRDDHSYSDH